MLFQDDRELNGGLMKVYGDPISGNCLKIRYTADYLDIDYQWIDVDILEGESRTDTFLAKNPAGQVPMVELDDGRILSQSNAIIGFLAEGSSLLADDAYLRAKAYEWMFWEQYSHEPYVAVCRFVMAYQGKPKEDREPWRVERGEAALDLMERSLEHRNWLVGEQFSVADISLVAYTRLAAEGGFDLSDRPGVRAWIARVEGELGLA
jgi:glutathione S-transferase